MIYWISVFGGIIGVAAGLWSDDLLNGADIPLTKEERSNPPTPTLVGRISTIGIGIAMVIFGTVHLLRG